MRRSHSLHVAALAMLALAAGAPLACAQTAEQPMQLAPSAGVSSSAPRPGPAAVTSGTTAPGWQPTVEDAARSQAERDLEAQQQALDLSRQQEAGLESGIEQLTREHSQLTDHLVETARQVQVSEAALSETEGKLGELDAAQKAKRAEFASQRGLLAKLLAALQRMGRDPPPILATERDDALKMVRSAMQLASVFPQLKDRANALAKNMAELDATIADIQLKNTQRLAEKHKLLDEQTRLAALLQQKRGELTARRGELDALRDLVGDQAKSVAGLSELIAKSDRAVAFRGTLGEADMRLQEPQVAAEVEPQVSPPGEPLAQPQGEQKVASIDPRAGIAGTANRLAPVPGHNFEKARGRLPMPVQGKRILKFGDPAKNVGHSKGEVFATRANAQITSPCDGLIVYAGDFRIFGQILIINAGGGYHVLLAGLGQIDVVAGQAVVAGEPVAKMGTGTGATADESAGAPILYVEFRNRDKPINPDPWWAGEAEKVQG